MSHAAPPPTGQPEQPYGAPPSGYPEPSPQAGQPPYYAAPSQSNGVAVAALIVGILSLPAVATIVLGPLLGIVAIVLGVIGVARAGQLGGVGRGMAIGGIVTGALAILATVVLFLGLFAFTSALVESGGSVGFEQEIPILDQ